jgi:hypothetical protein
MVMATIILIPDFWMKIQDIGGKIIIILEICKVDMEFRVKEGEIKMLVEKVHYNKEIEVIVDQDLGIEDNQIPWVMDMEYLDREGEIKMLVEKVHYNKEEVIVGQDLILEI